MNDKLTKPVDYREHFRTKSDSHDAQFLIDALIRSMEWRNDAKIQEFGEQLVAQWVGPQGAGEDGVFRLFGELEDSNFVVQVLHLSPERAEELEAGGHLTKKEAALLADVVAERHFQADGTSDYWDVARIESANGHEAYVAHTIQDGELWGAPECTFVGVFPSLGLAKQALKRLGYIDGEDFRRRYVLRNA